MTDRLKELEEELRGWELDVCDEAADAISITRELEEECRRLREMLYYATGNYHVAAQHSAQSVESCTDQWCRRGLEVLTLQRLDTLREGKPQ